MEVVRIDQTPPTTGKWRYTILYKQAIAGKRFWEIGFDGVDCMEIKYGYTNRPLSADETDKVGVDRHKVEPKGDRTIYEQAVQEMSRRYIDKVKEGYQVQGALNPPEVKAMKGYKYGEKGMGRIDRWPVVTQPKLDGMRLLIRKDGDRLSVRTWLNNVYTHLTHLEAEIKDLFLYLPPHSTLDGEIWSPNFTHNQIIGIVKSVVNIDPLLPKLCFYIFDIICEPNLPYEERYNMLLGAYGTYVKQRLEVSLGTPPSSSFRLLGSNLAHSHEEVMKHYHWYLEKGYEGAIIRRLAGENPSDKEYQASLYKRDRSKGLLKLKPVQDEEGLIIGVKEGKGREEGNAILVVKDPRGNIISMRMAVPFEQAKEWYSHPELVVGKEVTYEYSCLTDDQVPREPRGKSIRDYEGPDCSSP